MPKTIKKTEKNASKPMARKEKIGLAATFLVGAILFLYVAISTLSNWFKAPLLLAILFGSGYIMSKLGKFENYYGIIILRGEKGFGLMHKLSKHPRIMRALADFGLSLGFGMIYSYIIYRGNLRKFLAHFVLVSAFFLFLLVGSNWTVFGEDYRNFILPAIGILGGLLFFGVSAMVIQALNILTVPGSTAGATLVVPGVTIPLWEGLIAIIIAATVHEIAHGVLAMVEKLRVKNSGVILFGVLPIGAFVEPDEKKLSEIPIQKKRRILVAGTTSNFLMFLVFGMLLVPLSGYVLTQSDGVRISSLVKDGASKGILSDNEVIRAVNGVKVANILEFQNYMKDKKEGDRVVLTTDQGAKAIVLGKNGKLGIMPENNFPQNNFLFGILLFATSTIGWIVMINFALAVINLVPIFLTDGYRLVFEEARGAFPSKNDSYAKRIAIAAGALSVLLLLINLLPNLR